MKIKIKNHINFFCFIKKTRIATNISNRDFRLTSNENSTVSLEVMCLCSIQDKLKLSLDKILFIGLTLDEQFILKNQLKRKVKKLADLARRLKDKNNCEDIHTNVAVFQEPIL